MASVSPTKDHGRNRYRDMLDNPSLLIKRKLALILFAICYMECVLVHPLAEFQSIISNANHGQ